jgi:hypothetical protein
MTLLLELLFIVQSNVNDIDNDRRSAKVFRIVMGQERPNLKHCHGTGPA